MKQWLQKLNYKIARFMQGRHGDDRFNRFLTILGYIFFIPGLFRGMYYFAIAAVLIISYTWFRFLSKNEYARNRELRWYLRVSGKVKGFFRLQKDRWKDRKTHRYYRCPACHAVVRISKPGRGKTITITCPACRKPFDKRT